MLRVFLADDEPPARNRLKKLLTTLGSETTLSVVGEASDGIEAVEKLTHTDVDILFLDIQMPGYDGFEVLERLKPDNRPVVIFTTAYDEYAVRAFEASAVDYLLKPISKERLESSVMRASSLCTTPDLREMTEEKMGRLLDWMDAISDRTENDSTVPDQPEDSFLEHLSVPYRDRILIIPVERLVSVEISDGITRIFIVDDESDSPRPRLKQHIVNYTLDQLGALLNPQKFIRVHRSAIIQFDRIRELIPWFSGRYKVILVGGHEVIASRERSKALRERLNF
jgi:two-component system, LytTR family, response regulator